MVGSLQDLLFSLCGSPGRPVGEEAPVHWEEAVVALGWLGVFRLCAAPKAATLSSKQRTEKNTWYHSFIWTVSMIDNDY